jgi:mono/diheme cytochrome c family protein
MRNVKVHAHWPSYGVLRSLLAMSFLMAVSVLRAGIWDGGDVEKGKALFNANCASCHKVTNEVLAAPGLAGIKDRWTGGDELLVKWIQNPQAAAATGDPYIKSIVARYVPTYGWMSAQAVNADDVKHIMAYVQAPPDAGAAGAAATTDCVTIDELPAEEEDSSTSVWFLVLLVLFLIVALSAAGVSRTLKNAMREERGEAPLPDMTYMQRVGHWLWENKVFA